MIITKTQIDVNTLYEHRYLLSDDRIYNSLIVSTMFNKNVELYDIEMFIKRTDDHKTQFFTLYDTLTDMYILDTYVLLSVEVYNEQNNIECRTKDVIWLDTINELNDTLNNEINILTVERT